MCPCLKYFLGNLIIRAKIFIVADGSMFVSSKKLRKLPRIAHTAPDKIGSWIMLVPDFWYSVESLTSEPLAPKVPRRVDGVWLSLRKRLGAGPEAFWSPAKQPHLSAPPGHGSHA